MQRLLRAYGEFVGRRALLVFLTSFVAFLGLSAGWYKLVEGGVLSTKDLDEQWSMRGGDLEREVMTLKRMHNKDWESTAHLTMLLGKGSHEGADMFTPEMFAAVEPLYSRFFNMTVKTSSGREYSTEDLCARGAMPDYPGNPDACAAWASSNYTDPALQMACLPSPYFPCLVTSPQSCFSEHVAQLPDSYKPLDVMIDQVLPPSMLGRPYATRPSYRNLSAEAMKAEASKVRATGLRGCEWYTGLSVFSPAVWGGNVEWNTENTLMTKVEVIGWTLFYDAALRISFRLSLTKPEHADTADIEEALLLHEKAWQAEVEAFAETLPHVEVLNLGPSLEQEMKEENHMRWDLLIGGGTLMWFFLVVSLADFSDPLKSRLNLGQMGLTLVGTATAAAGGLMLLLGFRFNAVMVLALPFLAMGLGVDDMFVLIRYFTDLGVDFIAEKSCADIIGEVLARGGAGATLTSICNTVAFGCGALIPVPALADFCIGAAVISLFNFVAMFTQFLPMMVLEARRVKRKEPEPHPVTFFCHRRVLSAGREAGAAPSGASEARPSALSRLGERGLTVLKDWYGPCIAWLPVRIGIFILACGLAALCCWSVAKNKEIGFTVGELAKTGSHTARALEVSTEYFQIMPALICFHDLDVPGHQPEMLQLYEAVSKSPHAAAFDTLPFLSMFNAYVASMLSDVTLANRGWSLDNNWTHPIYAPLGVVTSNATVFYEAYQKFSTLPLDNPASAFLPGGNAFINADISFTSEFKLENGPGSRLQFSFFRFYMTNLNTQEDYVEAIEELRDIFAASPLPKEKAFPSSAAFTFWSLFRELEWIVLRVLAIDMVVIFLVALLFLRTPTGAVASVLACALIILQVYGVSVLFAKFNKFVAVALLATAGISIEFTSHLVAAFYSLPGPLPERLGNAMAHTTPPLLQGAASTLLSLLPMAFSPLLFVVKYFFGIFALVVAGGVLSGMFFLPALLALLEPLSRRCSYLRNGGAERESAPAGDSGNLPALMKAGGPAGKPASATGGQGCVSV